MADETSAQSSPEPNPEANKESDQGAEKEMRTESAEGEDKKAGAEAGKKTEPSLREPFPFARMFLAVVFGVIAAIAFWFLVVLAVLQFVTIAIAGQKNEELQRFSRLMGRYVQEVFDYMTLASDVQPFPLGSFPKE